MKFFVYSGLIIIAIIVLVLTYSPKGSDKPAWKIAAYNKGPIASGRIVQIEIATGFSSWSGDWTHYIIHLDSGSGVSLKDWEFRAARGLKIGDKITVYYDWSAGHVIDKTF